MEENKAQALLKKYLAGNCTEEEKAMLESWYLERDLEIYPDMNAEERLADKQQILASLEQAIAPKKRNILWPKMAGIAAVAFVTISFGLYTYLIKNSPVQQSPVMAKADVPPGGNKAVLTLANGQTINLSSNKKGIVIKTGTLAYNDGTKINTTTTDQRQTSAKNIISTPVGGNYQVVLPDGTQVWLNSASSLSYPTNFNARDRKVEITGEAYFEVAKMMIKDKANQGKERRMPFVVESKDQIVEVLGTHFNINSYMDENATKTTLLEGSVRVSASGARHSNLQQHNVVLKPNQQAILTGSNQITVQQVDAESEISWKNGYFKFNEDIKSIMNKIARWYDVDVVYKPGVDLSQTFSGEVSNSRNVSVLLKVMELTGNVHFKVEGRRIIVMP
ncbi:FecR family protein [Pedobacter nyackensis]|uniref:FecR family protein n=1 Tax=Pedobacter nyackensis TaxID=475255 RepID=A0A1W2ENY2_9SPHI|nr:FecR family protein [Pedobacter nyackensis]SMD11252.1 FecR family protein [Pedobacter nyackensis]